MAMRRKEIVEKNEIYYENYVMGRWKHMSIIIAIIFIFVNGIICWLANFLFKRMNFIKKAETLDLKGIEVMTWVDEQIQLTLIDEWTIGIICFFVAITGFVIFVHKKIKGYNLYKKKWVRIVPIGCTILFFLIICGFFIYGQNWIMAIITLFEAFQFIECFKVLLPLELREAYENFLKYTEWFSQHVIKRF